MSNDYALKVGYEMGRATGLEAAAEIILSLTRHKRRVVGTSELKAASLTLQSIADEIRSAAKARCSEKA